MLTVECMVYIKTQTEELNARCKIYAKQYYGAKKWGSFKGNR
jgi:hypothetical protein